MGASMNFDDKIQTGACKRPSASSCTVGYMSGSSGADTVTARHTTERGRRARAAIIDAAATMMYRHGVAGTSLDAVLEASGTGKSQLYHYFSDKSDLVAAVIERQLELVLDEQPGLAHVDTWQGLVDWAREAVSLHTRKGGPFACPLGTMAAELKNDEAFRPSLEAAFARWEAPLARGLRAMRDRGELTTAADPAELATMLVAALQGGMLLGRIRGDVAPLRDLLRSGLETVNRLRTAPDVVVPDLMPGVRRRRSHR